MTTDPTPTGATVNTPGIAAVAAVAYVLCDLLHELGHLWATLLPLGVKAVSISTVGLSTSGSSAVVAAAGPLANIALSLCLLVVLGSTLSPAWRYFGWLLGTVNLFNAAAYLLYSAILGTGDWAVVFDAAAPPSVWRPVAGLLGIVCYAVSVYASFAALRHLVRSKIVSSYNVERYCTRSYWTGGLLLTVAAAFNPTSPWLILTSGAATGFGAMVGLLLLPALMCRTRPLPDSASESLRVAAPWVVTGALTALIFVGVFGPGLQLE